MTQARWSAYKTSVLRHTVYNAPARAVITLIPRRQSVHVGERGRASGASRTELYMKDAQELGIRSHVNPKRVEAFDRMDHSPSDAIRKSVKEDAARAGNVGDDRGRKNRSSFLLSSNAALLQKSLADTATTRERLSVAQQEYSHSQKKYLEKTGRLLQAG